MSEEKPPEPPSPPQQPSEKKSGSVGCVVAVLLGFLGFMILGFGGTGATSVEDAVILVPFRVIWSVVVLVTTPGGQMFLISVIAIGVVWATRKRRKMGDKPPTALQSLPQALPQTQSEESSNQESEPSELPSSLQQPKKGEGLSILSIFLIVLGLAGLVSFIIICYVIKAFWTGLSNSGL